MIAETTIQRVRDLDILQVIRPFVQNLKQTGHNWTCLCPFHQEKTGSFSISQAKNMWYCFGCGEGGDGIAFVRKIKNVSYAEAVEQIAGDHGIFIEREEKPQTLQQRQQADLHRLMHETVEEVQSFFRHQFCLATAEAGQARQYAYSRWGEDFCNTAGIGYAPQDGGAFLQFCIDRKLPSDTLETLGYLKRNDRDGTMYPLLRGRITIPITDRRGHIVAFTCRAMDSAAKAKYMNSPNSPIFQKSEAIFGICEARRAASRQPYVVAVEGAPDVLRLQSIGIPNAVATLGTAWSDRQFDAIRKQIGVSSICFIPDADQPKGGGNTFGPGIKAVLKNGAAAIRKGMDVTVREIPQGENGEKQDADSFITDYDVFAGLPEAHFITWMAAKRFPLAVSMAEQRDLVAEIATLLAGVQDTMVQDTVVAELAKIHGKTRMWRDAVNRALAEQRRREGARSTSDKSERETELLKKYGLFVNIAVR